MHEVVFTRSHWSMTAPNKTQSLYSVLFELPGKETSCNSHTLQIPFHQYRSLLIMTKIPKRTDKIWKASFCALYIYIYIYSFVMFLLFFRQHVIRKQGIFLVSFDQLLQAQIWPTFTFSTSPWWRRCYKKRFKYSLYRCLCVQGRFGF